MPLQKPHGTQPHQVHSPHYLPQTVHKMYDISYAVGYTRLHAKTIICLTKTFGCHITEVC